MKIVVLASTKRIMKGFNCRTVLLSAIIGVLLCIAIVLNSGFQFCSQLSYKNSTDVDDHDHDQLVPITGAVGPESFAFNLQGEGPFTGVSDGSIIKWDEKDRRWIPFAFTSSNRNGCKGPEDEHICGRPLGIRFNERSGDLYIADAYKGLLVVPPQGGLAREVATEAQGIPFGLTNNLDIDQETGVVYFTDSSSRYQRRDYLSIILSEDKTGRLMKYDPQTEQVTVLLEKLWFPNGVALSQDGDFILVAETASCRVLKCWLKTSKSGTCQVFAQLPGFPDNIKKSPRGGFWVGVHSERQRFMDLVLSFPWTGKLLMMLPVDIMKFYSPLLRWRGRGLALRLSENGHVMETLNRVGNVRLRSVSEVEEKGGDLWIGSVNMPYAIINKVQT